MGPTPQRRTPRRRAPQRRHERHRGPYGLVAVGLGSALLLGACGGVGATGMGVVFLVLQRYFVEGIATTGRKG